MDVYGENGRLEKVEGEEKSKIDEWRGGKSQREGEQVGGGGSPS